MLHCVWKTAQRRKLGLLLGRMHFETCEKGFGIAEKKRLKVTISCFGDGTQFQYNVECAQRAD